MKETETIRDRRELEFAIFCIENIAAKTGKDAEWVYRALTEETDILRGYIVPEYEMLHTQELKVLDFQYDSEEWLDFFYHSFVYRLMSEGVSDMHCMSDEYLVEDLIAEYREV